MTTIRKFLFLLIFMMAAKIDAQQGKDTGQDTLQKETVNATPAGVERQRRNFQISFLPYVGTHPEISGKIAYRFSLNILGGYSRGVELFEAGGLFNLNRENMTGMQAAGLFNVVGERVTGFQGAGLFNISGKQQQGLQAAGLLNINAGSAEGVQAAGLMNINKSSKGLMAAGLGNVSDSLDGAMVAGLFNITAGGRATQIAGLLNVADTADIQLSGLVNTAKCVRGLQIGVLNFADTARGVPVGLLSFVKNGLHQIEISGDEIFYANASLRTGVDKFYNIISLGFQPGIKSQLWQVGYGIGSSFAITEKFRAEVNLSAHHVSGGRFRLELSEVYRLNPALEYKFSTNLRVAAGPTFNIYLNEHDFSYPGYNIYSWVGGKIAVRFF